MLLLLLGTKDAGAGWKNINGGKTNNRKKERRKNIYNIIGLFTCKTCWWKMRGVVLGWKIVLTFLVHV